MSFSERKAQRIEHYQRFVHGWKLRSCVACNGSGRYDAKGSPPCGACGGTGKERFKPDEPKTPKVGAGKSIKPDRSGHR